MKLSAWMARENLDDRAVSDALKRLDPNFSCSKPTVEKWRNGTRVPRSHALSLLKKLSGGDVTADDFVDELAGAA